MQRHVQLCCIKSFVYRTVETLWCTEKLLEQPMPHCSFAHVKINKHMTSSIIILRHYFDVSRFVIIKTAPKTQQIYPVIIISQRRLSDIISRWFEQTCNTCPVAYDDLCYLLSRKYSLSM